MLEVIVKLFNMDPSLVNFNFSTLGCCQKGDLRTDKIPMKDNKEKNSLVLPFQCSYQCHHFYF